MRRKTKNTIKTVGMTVLGMAMLVGVGAGVKALAGNSEEELKQIYPVFSVGGLNEETGKYRGLCPAVVTDPAGHCRRGGCRPGRRSGGLPVL